MIFMLINARVCKRRPSRTCYAAQALLAKNTPLLDSIYVILHKSNDLSAFLHEESNGNIKDHSSAVCSTKGLHVKDKTSYEIN